LFGLSTAYYLSFWSYFNVNVLQYMAVEDIIKGIAYPLRFAGGLVVGLVLFTVLSASLAFLFGKSQHVQKSGLAISLGNTLLAGGAYYFFADNWLLGMILSIALSVLVMALYYTMDTVHNAQVAAASTPLATTAEHPITTLFDLFLQYSAVLLSINAIIAGQVEARAIHSGRAYNYILAEDLPRDKIATTEPYLIYLGAISEKYIFLDRKGNERFIIDKGELPVLRVHAFEVEDTSAKAHFEQCVGLSLPPFKRGRFLPK
jgi:hypothetical protein